MGAASLQFFPQHPNAGAIAVSVLLVLGLRALVTIWGRARLVHRAAKTEPEVTDCFVTAF